MPVAAQKQTRLLLMPLEKEQDVVDCRNRARKLAAGCEFDQQDQIRIATAVSEIARNAFRYARKGTAEFALGNQEPIAGTGACQLICIVRDRGPGIGNLAEILAGRYTSATGMGMGLIGANKLMDSVDVQTGAEGTAVTMTKNLPRRKTVTLHQLQSTLDAIQRAQPVNPLDEISTQNQELLRTLDEVRRQREEMVSINAELRETNRGVVALYDELDTISRVGKVVASKLDRDLLLQAITTATTEISGADLGLFFYRQPDEGTTLHHHLSGRLSKNMDIGELDFSIVWQALRASSEVVRMDDLQEAGSPPLPMAFPFPLRSYMHVPVCDMEGAVVGALMFAHPSPNMFSERTERILSTVALQAAMGLENARLYHNARSASAAKDHFISTLSHELRTPLNPVFAILADLEQDATLSPDVLNSLVTMRRNLELEGRLIDDLLDLTRIERGEFPMRKEVIDLHEVLHAAYETCAASAIMGRITVRWDLRAVLFHVKGDASRLQQVFWNLIGNAIKFSLPGSVVVVSTESADDGTVQVSITDQGRGIRPEALRKIFQPFEQGDTTVAGRYGGLGLGLAISQSILFGHGGQIVASSPGPNLGSTFRINLPVTRPLTEVLEGPSTPVMTAKGIRILLVDDHEDTRLTMGRLLGRRGHVVTVADTCAEALTRARQQEFDLVLSDVGLPDGSGHDLMRSLRAEHPRLPGIALSGYGMASDLEKSRAAGFSGHLTKPIDLSLLEVAIADALAKPESDR